MESLKLKKQKSKPQTDFKPLQAQFQDFYNKQELWLIFEYCNFNPQLAYIVLKKTTPKALKLALRQYLINPHTGSKSLDNILQSVDDFFKADDDKQKEQIQIPKEEVKLDLFDTQVIVPGIITKVNIHVIQHICQFLHINEVLQFSMTSKQFLGLGQSNLLFKKYCLVLYKNLPILPEKSIFEELQEYIEQRPFEFHPYIRQQSQEDIRMLIWQEPIENFKTPTSYYKQFLNWKQMYLNAPRVNFSGYYKLKEKYIRTGEIGSKSQNSYYAPIFEVKYYRYVRFFSDGSFKHVQTNKKLDQASIIKCLKKQQGTQIQLSEKQYIKVVSGEYIKFCDKITMKFVIDSNIFTFNLEIRSSDDQLNNILIVNDQLIDTIEISHTFQQVLFKRNMDGTPKMFNYQYLKEFRQDLGNSSVELMTS